MFLHVHYIIIELSPYSVAGSAIKSMVRRLSDERNIAVSIMM